MMRSSPPAEFEYLKLNQGGAYVLRDGSKLPEATIAYETHGDLNAAADNAILVFHALSGTPHLTGVNVEGPKNGFWKEEIHGGWWDSFTGPGRALDTTRYFVICVNYLGGCYGSTGPASINPETGKPYGSSFPRVTAADIVDTQMQLLDALGIQKLHAVVGPSIGGLMALSLATRYPDRVDKVISIGSALEISSLQKIIIFEQIMAIENDMNFRGGDYYEGEPPKRGLALARIISHKTFISLATMERRARREVARFDRQLSWYKVSSPMESYMMHQGLKFVERFDANTYLRILEVWQKFEPFQDARVVSAQDLFAKCKHQQWLIFSVDSDVCFYPDQQVELAAALREADVPHMHITVHSGKGHDSFLLEPALYTPHVQFALDGGVGEHHR